MAELVVIVYHEATGKHLRTIVSNDYSDIQALSKAHFPDGGGSKNIVQMDALEYAQHTAKSFNAAAQAMIEQKRGVPAMKKTDVSILDGAGNIVQVIEAYPDYPQIEAPVAGVIAAVIPNAKTGGKFVNGIYTPPVIPDISGQPVEIELAKPVVGGTLSPL